MFCFGYRKGSGHGYIVFILVTLFFFDKWIFLFGHSEITKRYVNFNGSLIEIFGFS